MNGKDIELDALDAFILDMDGVVTRTAFLHAEAWKRMFDRFLKEHAERTGTEFVPFGIESDYLEYVDGKPRYRGAANFLESRDIHLPKGTTEDPPGSDTVCALGNMKNRIFHTLLDEKGAQRIESTMEFIRKAEDRGKKFAVISSSRNAEEVLASAGVSELFSATVGGKEADRIGLKGKPDPDIFLEAAKRLGTEPKRSAVVEDSQAGVEAGRKGGFALVVGIGSGEQKEMLLRKGADVVVPDLGSLWEKVGPSLDERVRIPLALDSMGMILSRLRQGSPALFLDYDGTLTPIVRHPADAVLSSETGNILRDLSSMWPVAVISGRDLNDVMDMVDIDGLVYAGSHGFDVSGADITLPGDIRSDELLSALDRAVEKLGPAVEDIPGARLERKKFAIALHYRESPPEYEDEMRELAEEAAKAAPELRVSSGKKIFELRPDVEWDKGRALRALLEGYPEDDRDTVPIYIGDDTTDEDAFEEIRKDGIGILVSGDRKKPTSAGYILRDTGEVARFLEELLSLAESCLPEGEWKLIYDEFDPSREQLRETLCATGNGYFVTRGAAPESTAGEHHYPGTYIGGCYNRRVSHISGRDIENESIVNMPNWLPLTFKTEEGEWFQLEKVRLKSYRQELDMASGVLRRDIEFTDGNGRTTRVAQTRFAHMDERHMAGLRTEIVPVDWSGSITVRSALDARIENSQVKRYQQLDNHHLKTLVQGCDGDSIIWVEAQTNQSRIRVAEAARTEMMLNGEAIEPERMEISETGYAGQDITLALEKGDRLRVDKVAAVYTSRDQAISESLIEARTDVREAGSFDELLLRHILSWQRLWNRCHIETNSTNEGIGRILNLHIFHLLQTVSVHSIGTDVGVPPRGLHGEAYRGLIMWDELFIFPFIDLRIPDLTRTLLLYRYRRMRHASIAASKAGCRGVMFPWQSGSNGREEAQKLHLNPASGHWIPDNSQLQRHINIAVAYNVWNHYEVTGDVDFLSFYGAEMLIQIARFWASIAHVNRERDRYEIHGVMGPDEFHDAYPDAEEPGLNNNAYTNVMVAWVMGRALDTMELLPPDRRTALWEKLHLSGDEMAVWKDMSTSLFIPFHDDGIISQFEGYGSLREFDWEEHRKKHGDIHRLDRILEAEGDSPNNYKVSKQADVLMLFFLLSSNELEDIFNRLGYGFDREMITRNVEYYLRRTSHGSTLSRIVHSWVMARSGRSRSWDLFKEALYSDVADIQGGTTHEGIHLGAMAGTVDLVQRCYTGLETRDGILRFDPNLPDELTDIVFNVRYRQNWMTVKITHEKLSVSSRKCDAPPVKVGIPDDVRVLEPGASLDFRLKG